MDVSFFAPSLRRYETSEFSQGRSCSLHPVSVTGAGCELLCDHCRAFVLGDMEEARTPEALLATASALAGKGAGGILISGGSDIRGSVPLMPFVDTLAAIRRDLSLKVLVHTGITGSGLAAGLAHAGIDAALIDIVGSHETIRRVCHLQEASTADYDDSLGNLLEAGVKAVPHVVIGLDRGRIDGEFNAIDIISRHDVAALVLVGLRPLPGTPMADVEPPSPLEMSEVFRYARAALPSTPLLLGCERPAGRHREETDILALQAGLDGIAYPADGTVAAARRLGLEPCFSEMCCALLFEEAPESRR